MKKLSISMMLMILLVFITSCMPGGGNNGPESPAGFFMGIWHGWIAPVSLIIGFFNDSITIYEPYNTGWWYDLGFYIAIVGGFGSFSFFRRDKKDRN